MTILVDGGEAGPVSYKLFSSFKQPASKQQLLSPQPHSHLEKKGDAGQQNAADLD
jgi:hypothetical protein